MPGTPLDYPSGRHVKQVFDFAARHKDLLYGARQEPVAGILVGSQTIDWFEGRLFVNDAYKNCYHGAFQILKELCYASEPFLDYRLDAETIRQDRRPQAQEAILRTTAAISWKRLSSKSPACSQRTTPRPSMSAR